MPRIELIGGPRAGTEGNRRVIREAFAAHGGDEVDAQGDSFLDVFGRAQDAALAAAQAQRALTTPEEGYHGAGVHRAARVMAAGHEVRYSPRTRWWPSSATSSCPGLSCAT